MTGGSSGIGLAVARALGEQAGYAVTISGRREEKLRAAAEELRSAGLEVLDVVANMSDEQQLRDLVAAHREHHGRLDVLVNNAGVGIGGAIDDYQTKYLDMQLDVNLRGTIICTREALPMLRAAGAEHRNAYIINTASIAGRSGQPWLSIYGATKAALINWTNGLQQELGKCGIRVTALSPAFVETPMTTFAQGAVPPEEMIRPEDLAHTVVWLLSLSEHARVPNVFIERIGEEV